MSAVSLTVGSASLLFTAFGSNLTPFDIDVFVYSGDGLLSLSDFDQGSLATSFTYSGEASVAIDLTTPVNDFVLAGTNFLGVNLRMVGIGTFEDRSRSVAFHTGNTPVPDSFQPTLFLDESAVVPEPPETPSPPSIPEPTTLALFAFGLAGLGLMVRRRQRTDSPNNHQSNDN